jgi:hypothetical protein
LAREENRRPGEKPSMLKRRGIDVIDQTLLT